MAKAKQAEPVEEAEGQTLDAAEQAVSDFEFEPADTTEEAEEQTLEPAAEVQDESDSGQAPVETDEGEPTEDTAPDGDLVEETQDESTLKSEAAKIEPEDGDLSPRLLHAGRRAGLSEDDMDALGDQAEGVLGKLAESYDAVMLKMQRLGSPRLMPPEQPPAQPATEEPAPAPVAPAEAPPAATPFKLDLDEDLVDPDLIEALRPIEAQMNALQSTVTAFEAREAKQQAEEAIRFEARLRTEVNTFFAKVDEDYGGIFGEGATADLPENSPELKARLEVLREADIIAAGASTRGFDMDTDEALDRGLSLMSREQQQKAVRRTFTNNAKRRSGQRIARPARRTTERVYKTAEAKAEAALVEAARDKGHSFAEDE